MHELFRKAPEGRLLPIAAGTRRIMVLAVTVLMAGSVIAYTQAAGAAPKPTIAQVKAQINSLQAQVDQIGQQFDKVSEQLTAAKARLTSAQRQSGQSAQRFTIAQAQLKQVAVASFESGNQSSVAAVISSGDPQQVLRQAALLQELGSVHAAQTAKYLTAARQVASAQQQLQRTKDGITQLQSQLKAKKAKLDKLLATSQSMLNSLTAQQRAQVAAAAIGSTSSGSTGSTSSGSSSSSSGTSTVSVNSAAGKAVNFAYAQIGKPYLWGGTGPDAYDCSGLVQAAWGAAGVVIPRTTYEQLGAYPYVPKADLQPGDLVFFDSGGHVAIYVGGGNIIDAPQTGETIRKLPLSNEWYTANYYTAVRP